MDVKKVLTDVVTGVGEGGKTVVTESAEIVKAGAMGVGDLVHMIFGIAKETGKDVEELVKDVVVGAVNGAKETAGASEEAAATIIMEAENAAKGITDEGGKAVVAGVENAKKILQAPLK